MAGRDDPKLTELRDETSDAGYRAVMKIFFSWQADLPTNASTGFIRRCLKDAANELESERNISIAVEEATTGSPGSPYIPDELAEKIRKCDIFVCDITAVIRLPHPQDEDRAGKSLPNPNVTFELGLAAAHVGWRRVIMLFNSGLAEFDQLPFDFDRHRMTLFSVTPEQAKDAGKRKDLTKTLKTALALIIDGDPARPRDLEGKTPDEIKHARDVAAIRSFFRQLSVDFLHQHLRDLPQYRNFHAAWMHDGAHAVVDNPGFDLYDVELKLCLKALVTELGNTLKFNEMYSEMNRSNIQSFGTNNRFTDPMKEQQAADTLAAAGKRLEGQLRKAIDIVRDRYLEVDLADLSRQLEREYHTAIPTG